MNRGAESRFHRFRRVLISEPNLRLAVVVAGVVMLAAGVIAALRADASTALLVVGGVLLVAGLVFEDWREIIFRHGETEARLLRAARVQGVADVVHPTRAAIEELVESSDEDVRPALRQLNENLEDYEVLTTTTASAVSSNDSVRNWTITLPSTGMSYTNNFAWGAWGEATHEVRPDQVFLRLTPGGFTPTIIECEVSDSEGNHWVSGDRSWLLLKRGPSAELVFPDNFPEAELREGTYTVAWSAIAPDSIFMSDNVQTRQVVARDSFAVEAAGESSTSIAS